MIALLLAAGWSQDCLPFGVRLSLGEAYNPKPLGRALLRVAFNTAQPCEDIAVTFNSRLSCKHEQLTIAAP
jgi:hypothetical protein